MSELNPHQNSIIVAKKGVKIALVVSEYNDDITQPLFESCQDELVDRGVDLKNIKVVYVPGSFELPHACQGIAKSKKYDAVVALGAVIRGETPHFDTIAFAAAHGIMTVGLEHDIPVVFGVLTTDNRKQAEARIRGGKRGDKGKEAAITALKMLDLKA